MRQQWGQALLAETGCLCLAVWWPSCPDTALLFVVCLMKYPAAPTTPKLFLIAPPKLHVTVPPASSIISVPALSLHDLQQPMAHFCGFALW